MPAGAATPQRLGTIDPSSLIGRPENIVEPRNVALLSDAFRQGFITADDVISRVGELGKTKEKAELTQAQEAISPEQQALRAQQVAAGTEQAALAEAQAERGQILQQYPAIAYFDKLAPAAGIQAPTLPDGTPDYPAMEKLGAQLAVHQAQRAEAQAKLDNIVDQVQGNNIFSKTKQGEIVDQNYVADLRKQATAPFQQQAPGSVQTMVEPRAMTAPAPVAAPAVSTGEPIDQLRARMAEKFGLEKIIQLSEDELRRLDAPAPMVTPRAAPTAAPAPVIGDETPPAGTRVGAGTSLGPLPAKPANVVAFDPVKRASDLADSQVMLDTIDSARNLVATPGIVGPMAGSAPVAVGNRLGAAFGIRNDEFESQRELEILISKKILEGAQLMKGNLSDRDIRFLKESTPRLSDSPALWNTFLDNWKNLTEQNINILSGGTPGTGLPSAGGETAQTKPSSAPIITLPSGKRVQRDAQGNFQPVQ